MHALVAPLCPTEPRSAVALQKRWWRTIYVLAGTSANPSVLVSYCTVCRTGRVFSPVVNGTLETFRLVGMDHFNAMFEDKRTGSWWRQATGEAIVGPLKGKVLQEFPSRQMTLAQWLALYPKSLIMQADTASREKYAKGFDFETGSSRKKLTGTDTASWREKAWVVGVTLNGESKAYDWNRLKREGTVNDEVGGTPIVLALASDRANSSCSNARMRRSGSRSAAIR